MSFNDWFQINYATQDHISTVGLTEVFSAIDSANRAGYMINHSNDPKLLMIDPEHLFDVADSLGCPIKTPKNKLEVEFKKLIWPKYLGEREFRTAMWPSNKRVRCWTFDINKSESYMTHEASLLVKQSLNKDQIVEHLDQVQSSLGVWRDTLMGVPSATQIALTAAELANLLSGYYEAIDKAKSML